ncbi:hypothetical protein [Streptomyces sp. SID13031]|uniref:hypothetical protein n=1 Tax=Streptomyces sp. SID13031 TaxID=2706046 RepID=UPI0013CA7FC2|nr:hypothetical protein [Streptomyces sp. SID13031]NEA34819.1 hypothetical protein [Streptomyces sp. SID13031]
MPNPHSLRATLLTATGLTPDLTTDVGRWQLYRTAAEDTASHATLLQAATVDPDRALVMSLVVHLPALTATADHPTWLAALAPSERAYATQRSTEYALLRTRPPHDTLTRDLDTYTNWLQLRLAESLTHKPSLLELADRGRTKRIRNLATTRRAASPADLHRRSASGCSYSQLSSHGRAT